MKTAGRGILYGEISRHNPVTLEVEPGERFRVETEMNTGSWLQDPADTWSPEKRNARNPVSGCIAVRGAEPGQALAVRIHRIELAGVGYTASNPGPDRFGDYLRRREWGVFSRTVRIEGGYVLWNDRLRIPVQPMIGVIGCAPAEGAAVTVENGPFGGNMDVQEVAEGSTILLPVEVGGGLLHVGDVHAVMGDGEICGAGGIETRASVILSADPVARPESMRWPRIEMQDEIMTVGCARPAEEAFRIALQELLGWMCETYGFRETDAYLLLGQVLRARCTQFVDPLFTYVCSIRREFLVPG